MSAHTVVVTFFDILVQILKYLSFLVVAVAGLRHVLAMTEIWPKRGRFGDWIYRGHASDPDALRRQLLDRIEDPQRKLVVLLRKYMRASGEKLEYGLTTKTYSNFYIDTMEAAQEEADLDVMVDLLKELLRRHSSKEHPPNPDFVIVPKGGNPLLGRRFAQGIKALSILAKAKEDSAFIAATDKRARLHINFEGVERVLKLEQQRREEGKQLYGICVDCNLAGGRGIREAVDSFNELCTTLGLNIRPVQAVYVLFRATNTEPDTQTFEKLFTESGLAIYRYFDLSENAKRAMSELSSPTVYSPAVLKEVDGFIQYLADSHLLKGIE